MFGILRALIAEEIKIQIPVSNAEIICAYLTACACDCHQQGDGERSPPLNCKAIICSHCRLDVCVNCIITCHCRRVICKQCRLIANWADCLNCHQLVCKRCVARTCPICHDNSCVLIACKHCLSYACRACSVQCDSNSHSRRRGLCRDCVRTCETCQRVLCKDCLRWSDCGRCGGVFENQSALNCCDCSSMSHCACKPSTLLCGKCIIVCGICSEGVCIDKCQQNSKVCKKCFNYAQTAREAEQIQSDLQK